MKGKGKHPEKALTAVQVRQLKQPGRYADGNGLYLVADPSGAKRWLLRLVVQGRRRDIGLGGGWPRHVGRSARTGTGLSQYRARGR